MAKELENRKTLLNIFAFKYIHLLLVMLFFPNSLANNSLAKIYDVPNSFAPFS